MARIDNFWNGKRYLFYGFSRKPKSIAREVYKKLTGGGIEFIPIRKDPDEIDGVRMVGDVSKVEGNIDGAFIIVNPKNTIGILDELHDAGIKRIFLQIGAYNKDITEKVELEGFEWETGCALMRFDKMGFPHSTHRWVAKRFGGMK
jgi:predicted CoA-binding protein